MIKDIIIHKETAPGPNTPDHPQALVTLPQNTRQNAVLARHRATWGRPTYGECGAISGLLFLAKRSFSASASKF